MRARQLLNIILAVSISIGAGLITRDINQGNCSETALDKVIANGGEIQFEERCEITLSGSKTVTHNLTITGGTFVGDNEFALFVVQENVRLILDSATFKRGNPVAVNDGTLLIRNSTLQDNEQGIINRGIVDIGRTEILDTSCVGCNGAVLMNMGSAGIAHSRISRASAMPDPNKKGAPAGGAIFNRGYMFIIFSEISRARAGVGGAIFNLGDMEIARSTLRNNEIYTLTNGVGHGGAIDNHGNLDIMDSTIERNTTTNMGGGINNHNDLIIRNSIIMDNRCTESDCTGADIFNYDETGTANIKYNYWGEGSPAPTIYGTPERAYSPWLAIKPQWAR